jgi:hypothetical protein
LSGVCPAADNSMSSDQVRHFLEGLAKRLGERAADLVWTTPVVGAFIAWFTAPQVYELHLTRLGIVAYAFTGLLLLSAAFWMGWRLRRRRRFHATQVGGRGLWGTAVQKDGSTVIQFTFDLLVKNLTDEPLRFVRVRLMRPRIKGKIIHEHMDSGIRVKSGPTRGSLVPPREAQQIFIGASYRGTWKVKMADVPAVFALVDDEGREQRVRVDLHNPAIPR